MEVRHFRGKHHAGPLDGLRGGLRSKRDGALSVAQREHLRRTLCAAALSLQISRVL
jgi:hypothetical protein